MGMKRHARGIAILNDDVNLPSSHVWNKILWTFAISLLFPSVYSFNFSVWEYFPGKIDQSALSKQGFRGEISYSDKKIHVTYWS